MPELTIENSTEDTLMTLPLTPVKQLELLLSQHVDPIGKWGAIESVVLGQKKIEVTFTYGPVKPHRIRRGVMTYIDTGSSPGYGRIMFSEVWEDEGKGTYRRVHNEPLSFSTRDCEPVMQETSVVAHSKVDPSWMIIIHVGGDKLDRKLISK